jgi:hypothetical protein
MDNVIEALGKGRNKKGKGLKEIKDKVKEVKDKVVNYVKKNKVKILKDALIGVPIGLALGATAKHLLSQRRRAEPRRRPAAPFVPFSGQAFRLPLRPGEPPRPVGAGFKEVKDNVVNFVKKHKGKIATAGKLAALAAIYKNSDKILDYVDKTKLGQTQIGQNILGNLGYAQGHIDVYSGILQHLFNKYRRDVLGFGVC